MGVEGRHHNSINVLLDQLLKKLCKSESDAADKVAASTSAANAPPLTATLNAAVMLRCLMHYR